MVLYIGHKIISEKIYKDFYKQKFECSYWNNPTAVTLTLEPRNSANSILTDAVVRKEVRHLLNRLGRKYFGNKHKKKSFRRLVIWERGEKGLLHLHMAIERPTETSISDFESYVMSVWISLEWGLRECRFTDVVNKGWLNYILKNKSKDSLDWSVDLENSVAE